MKIFKAAVVIVIVLTCFIACQKELQFEPSGIAAGTLKKDAAGDCMPSAVTGIYKVDSTLTSDNFIDVNVDVTNTGTYTIVSDTVNGFSFKGAGSFTATGTNIVRLQGTGKPIAAGVSSFVIKYGTSSCVMDITVMGIAGSNADFLLGGSPSSCAGFTLGSGTYTAGQPLLPTNNAVTQVQVLATGSYAIGTDTINGMYFRAVGAFSTLGVQSLTIVGQGTPVIAGSFNFTLKNATSSCTFSITVAPAGGGTAVFTMGGAPGNCTGVTTAGTYTQGVAMIAANTIKVDVNVTTPGTYNIVVLSVNNVSFSAAGNFTTLGSQQITLNASGTPTGAGSFNYIIAAPGGSNCTFPIVYAVAPITPPTNLDYLPQTPFSNWSTKLDGGGPGDTTYMQVSANTIVKSTITYNIFEIKDNGTPTDSLYFRKNTGKYFQYLDDFQGLLDNPYNKDIQILDSTLGVGGTWTINLPANSAGGLPIASAKIINLITAKGAVETVEGNTYPNVIKVKYSYYVNLGFGPDVLAAEEDRWYAKGKGVIYSNIDVIIAGTMQKVLTTRTQIF